MGEGVEGGVYGLGLWSLVFVGGRGKFIKIFRKSFLRGQGCVLGGVGAFVMEPKPFFTPQLRHFTFRLKVPPFRLRAQLTMDMLRHCEPSSMGVPRPETPVPRPASRDQRPSSIVPIPHWAQVHRDT